jgi:pyridoxine kinase
MPTIISISSRVVRGTVGGTLASFVLQRMGHVVRDIPTVMWDRHPGLGQPSGFALTGAQLTALLADSVAPKQTATLRMWTTGYFASGDQIDAVRDHVLSLRRTGHSFTYCCDPICGDAPGLYVPPDVLDGLRSELLPLADAITPNRFELGLLTGMPVATNAEVIAAARALGRPACLVTSAFGTSTDTIANMLVTPDTACMCQSRRRTDVPNGTGDLMTALFAGLLAQDVPAARAMARAAAGVEAALDATARTGDVELAVVAAKDAFVQDNALPLVEVRT